MQIGQLSLSNEANAAMNRVEFLKKVDKTPSCWLWTGATRSNGRGAVKIDGRIVSAYRVSYLLFVGKIKRGFCICHKCDNSLCVNPQHLFMGTRSDNMKDAVNKGRIIIPRFKAFGKSNGNFRISQLKIKKINKLYAEGHTGYYISKKLKLNKRYVYRVINGERRIKG